MHEFEKAVAFKALLSASQSGAWEKCLSILSAQYTNSSWWIKESLMGESPEIVAFKRSLKGLGLPDERLYGYMNKDCGSKLSKLLIRAYESNQIPEDKGLNALTYLAGLQRFKPWSLPYHEITTYKENIDTSGWAHATAKLIQSDQLAPEWLTEKSFWVLTSIADDHAQECLADALIEKNKRNVFAAFVAGADVLSHKMMESLSPEASFCLLFASQCGRGYWADLKAADPSFDWNKNLDFFTSIENKDDDVYDLLDEQKFLERNYFEKESLKRYKEVLNTLIEKSSPILKKSSTKIKKWAQENLEEKFVVKVWPDLISDAVFEEEDARGVSEKLCLVLESGIENEESLVDAAVRRLIYLVKKESTDLKYVDWFNYTARDLWNNKNVKVFCAFVDKLGEQLGSTVDAMIACGFPREFCYRSEFVQSPEHVFAILDRIPLGEKDESGECLWGSNSSRNMAIVELFKSVKCSANLAFLSKEFDKLERWQEALIQIVTSALKSNEAHRFVAGFLNYKLSPSDAPMPKVFDLLIDRFPSHCADFFTHNWSALGDHGDEACRVCALLSKESLNKIKSHLPASFEASAIRWGSSSSCSNIPLACRLAAKSLEKEEGPGYSSMDTLCAALLVSSSYGLAVAKQKSGATVLGEIYYNNSKHLSEMLPESARALLHGEWAGHEGYSSDELVGKALWGFLSHNATNFKQKNGVFFEKLWEDVTPKSNQWTDSCLAGLFSSKVIDSHPDNVFVLLSEVLPWLNKNGLQGYDRIQGEKSALEFAVYTHGQDDKKYNNSNATWKDCVGLLIDAGADPSSLNAPYGMDAFALCAKNGRNKAPTTLFKELLRSKKAMLGQGALWSILAANDDHLSENLKDEVFNIIKKNIHPESLFKLAWNCSVGRVSDHLSATLNEDAVSRSYAPELLGQLAQRDASANVCVGMALAMKSAGIDPNENSKNMLTQRLMNCYENLKYYSIDSSLNLWLEAGAVRNGWAQIALSSSNVDDFKRASNVLGLDVFDTLEEWGLCFSALFIQNNDIKLGSALATWILNVGEKSSLKLSGRQWVDFVNCSSSADFVRKEMGERWSQIEGIAIESDLNFSASKKSKRL